MTSARGPQETSGVVWEAWLLAALADIGRPAKRGEVHSWVYDHCGGAFQPADFLPRLRQGRKREPAWQNDLDSCYDRLKKRGVLVQIGHSAPWTLSGEAKERAELCRAAALSTPPRLTGSASRAGAVGAKVEDGPDLLSDFKPGTGFAYRSHLVDRALLKSRDHEPLLDSFGRRAAERGWRATTRVHPRDLVLYRGEETWLVEVKVLRCGNAVGATREAVAQLLEYSHFLHPEEPPRLLAVFNETIGDALLGHLVNLGIEAVRRTGDDAWQGTLNAVLAGLADD